MTVKAIPNGVTMRLNVESGVIKTILDLLPGQGFGGIGGELDSF